MEMTSVESARQCVARHSLSTNFLGKAWKASCARIFTCDSYIFQIGPVTYPLSDELLRICKTTLRLPIFYAAATTTANNCRDIR